MKSKLEIVINDIDKRLQFVGILVLFFPTLINSLFIYADQKPKDIAEMSLKLGFIIFFFILNYLCFEWRKTNLTLVTLRYINWVLFFTISCFGYVIIYFALMANGNVQSYLLTSYFLYAFSILGLMVASPISILIMIVESVISEIKSH